MIKFVQHIKKTLHCTINDLGSAKTNMLPLYLTGSYELQRICVANVEFLLAKPKESINLATLRRQREQLIKFTGMECVLCMTALNSYARKKMLDEAIPFIILEKEIYMPFLGVALSKCIERNVLPVDKIAYVTQKLLLMAIYGHWQKITLTAAAKAIGVTKMTATRCFDELGALLPGITEKTSRNRYFTWEHGDRELWKTIQPLLRSPVYRLYPLEKRLDIAAPLGGMSAICQYSIMADNSYRTYAVSKQFAKDHAIDQLSRVPNGEIPATVVQVLHYQIGFADNRAIDPLTAISRLRSAAKSMSSRQADGQRRFAALSRRSILLLYRSRHSASTRRRTAPRRTIPTWRAIPSVCGTLSPSRAGAFP